MYIYNAVSTTLVPLSGRACAGSAIRTKIGRPRMSIMNVESRSRPFIMAAHANLIASQRSAYSPGFLGNPTSAAQQARAASSFYHFIRRCKEVCDYSDLYKLTIVSVRHSCDIHHS